MQALPGLLLIVLQFIILAYLARQNDHPFIISLSCLLTFHLSVAMTLQIFVIFSSPTVLWANALFVAILTVVAFVLSRHSPSLGEDIHQLFRLDWILLSTFTVALIFLLSVHNNYTGLYSTELSGDYHTASHLSYQYPYFVDEWYAVSLIRNAIDTRSLPTQNPFVEKYERISNFEAPFHAFLAEV